MSKWYAINFDGVVGLCAFNPDEESGFPMLVADTPSEMEEIAIGGFIMPDDIDWSHLAWSKDDDKIADILSDLESAEIGIDEIETIIDDVKSVDKLSGIEIPDLSDIYDEDDLIDAWYDLQSAIEEAR